MFDLKYASPQIRKCAAAFGIKSGKYEPVNSNISIDALDDESVVVKVYNRNHPDGVKITAGDVRYAGLYL